MVLQYFKKKENQYKVKADEIYSLSIDKSKKIIKDNFLKKVNFDSSFEITSIIFTKYKLFIFNEIPKYSFKETNLFDWEEKDENGINWHKKNYKSSHSSRCFDVSYEFNNVGARDVNDYFTDDDKKSIILICMPNIVTLKSIGNKAFINSSICFCTYIGKSADNLVIINSHSISGISIFSNLGSTELINFLISSRVFFNSSIS